ncbi:TetR/AcrR family transcriptional regulator [Flammeovirga kamogawensis]|uniref:TetR/AcrR family transcriptional regulator n=1 Tax=Flammeovirga kamogawensis TaxID=373891 RepID=A0ABX8H4A0_9BACT|nr:TetR/AcrR family transcriptional regulator [Flammeovirga kamogawensis]MBB6461803.1 AcrR family transcriptional regulator [Flammeovirga kamogawensis]QWG10719.1 TetR/AcrR family transcriptional regulator [Flammeovirga kamogawensis]TRX63821.1 TetR/AcrR family transcriptional regulator [Flammeovirga kamogawensis]
MEQKLKSEITKQLILDTAFKLFYRDGFNLISINQIMKETALTKGAFYHHFKNKEEIGKAVITEIVEQRIVKNMIDPLYEEGDIIEKLKNIFTLRIKKFSIYEKEKGCPTNNLINEISGNEEVYRNALKVIIDKWRKVLVKTLDIEREKGTIKNDVNSNAVAVFLISSFEGVRGLRKLYRDDVIFDNYLLAVNQYIDQLK